MTCPPPDAPKAQTLRPPLPAICSAHTVPPASRAFIHHHLGRVEQTYVAKGRLFLFIKFMASPRLHTVKSGRIGPKVSCRMTASDVCTSVNSVGAVEENKVDDSSKARRPVTRCGQPASRKGIGVHTRKRGGSGSAGGHARWHQDPAPSWPQTLSGRLQVARWESKNLILRTLRSPATGPSSWREF